MIPFFNSRFLPGKASLNLVLPVLNRNVIFLKVSEGCHESCFHLTEVVQAPF